MHNLNTAWIIDKGLKPFANKFACEMVQGIFSIPHQSPEG